MPMPKKAIEYVIQCQEQFNEDIRKRSSLAKEKVGFCVTLFSIYTQVYSVYIPPSLLHKVV